MKYLTDIIYLIKSKKITAAKISPSNNSSSEKKGEKFYQNLLAGKYTDDKSAIKDLYGSNTKHNTLVFNVIKKRTLDHLYNSVLMAKEDRYPANSYQRAFLYCNRHYVAARLLLFFSASRSGYRLMRKVLRKAEIFEIFEIAQLCYIALRRESLLRGDEQKFENYDLMLKKTGDTINAEITAEGLYYRLLIPFSKSLYIPDEFEVKVKENAKVIDILLKSHHSFQLNILRLNIGILKLNVMRDYTAAAEKCDEAINYLSNNDQKFYSKVRHGNFLLQKMDNLLLLKNYELCYNCAMQCFTFFPSGSSSWYLAKEFYFLTCLNNGNYKEASLTYSECTYGQNFKDLAPAKRESWLLMGGFLWYLLTHENLTEYRNRIFVKLKKYSFAWLANSLDLSIKDKKGSNVSLIILKTLLLLQEHAGNRDYKKIMLNADSLKNYLNSHIDNTYVRERLILKLLISISDYQFKVNRKTDRIKKILSALKESDKIITPMQAKKEIISFTLLAHKLTSDLLPPNFL